MEWTPLSNRFLYTFNAFIRWCGVTLLFLGIISIGLIGILLLQIQEKPKSFPWLTAMVTHVAEQIFDHTIIIHDVELRWDKQRSAISLHVTDLHIIDPTTKNSIGEFPEIEMEYSGMDILYGRLIPAKLVIAKAWIDMTQSASTHTNSLWIAGLLAKDSLPFKVIHIANLMIKTRYGDLLIQKFDTERQQQALILRLESAWNEKLVVLDLKGKPSVGKPFQMQGNFSNIPLGILVAPMSKTIMVDHVLSGTLTIDFSNTGLIDGMNIHIEKTNGQLYYVGWWEKPLKTTIHNLKLTLNKQDNSITCPNYHVVLDDMITLKGKGNISHDQDGQLIYDWDTEITGLDFSQLPYYWPSYFGASAHAWVKTHMPKGKVTYAKGTFHLDQAMLQGNIPAKAVDAIVKVEDGVLDYYQGLPAIVGMAYEAHFNADRIAINVQKGTIKHSAVSGNVVVPLKMQPGSSFAVTVDARAKGHPNDLIAFIPSQTVKETYLLQQVIHGVADTTLTMHIPLMDDLTFDDMIIDTRTDIKQMAINSILAHESVPLTNGQMMVHFDGNQLTCNGQSHIGGVPARFEWRMPSYQEEKQHHLSMHLKAGADNQILDSIWTPHIIAGNVDATLELISSPNQATLHVNIDGQNAEMEWESWNQYKKNGEAFNGEMLVLFPVGKEGVIERLTFEGKELAIRGNGELRAHDLAISKLTIAPFKWGKNHLDIHMMLSSENVRHLKVKGTLFDFENFHLLDTLTQKPTRVPFVANVQVDAIHMKNHVTAQNVHAEMRCDTKWCYYVDMQARLMDNQHASIQIRTKEGIRHLEIESNNGGDLLRGMGIFSGIRGGDLLVNAASPEPGSIKMAGKLKLYDFEGLQNLALASEVKESAPDVSQILKEKTIPFEKLTSTIAWDDANLYITEMKGKGKRLGVTMEGKASMFGDHSLDFKGYIMPHLMGINQLLGKIPLVGELLQGGKDRGLIAVEYQLKGNAKNPEFKIIPLSLLLPGPLRFFRDMFGG